MIERNLARQWRATIGHLQDGAERLQATAYELPPELSSASEPKLNNLVAKHTRALFDHTVTLNCLSALIAGGIERGSS